MSKHTITVKLGNAEYTVSTDSNVFSVNGIEFKFSDNPKTETKKRTYFKFDHYDTWTTKIEKIKAVRVAMGCGIGEGKEIVENEVLFPAQNEEDFKEYCLGKNIRYQIVSGS